MDGATESVITIPTQVTLEAVLGATEPVFIGTRQILASVVPEYASIVEEDNPVHVDHALGAQIHGCRRSYCPWEPAHGAGGWCFLQLAACTTRTATIRHTYGEGCAVFTLSSLAKRSRSRLVFRVLRQTGAVR